MGVVQSVREVLRRPLYRGDIIYNRTGSATSGAQKRQNRRPDPERITIDRPELRIVPKPCGPPRMPDSTPPRTCISTSTGGKRFGRPVNGSTSKYLLTGVRSLRALRRRLDHDESVHGSRRRYFYACGWYHQRGPAVCTNHQLYRWTAPTRGDRQAPRRPPESGRVTRAFESSSRRRLTGTRPDASNHRTTARARGEQERSATPAAVGRAEARDLSSCWRLIREREARRTEATRATGRNAQAPRPRLDPTRPSASCGDG